jgi:hypothetical protein
LFQGMAPGTSNWSLGLHEHGALTHAGTQGADVLGRAERIRGEPVADEPLQPLAVERLRTKGGHATIPQSAWRAANMFRIEMAGPTARRVVSDSVLSQADFDAIAAELGVAPSRARKNAFVAASRAQEATFVETRWKSEVTSNEAKPGDWIVVNLDRDKQPLREGDNLNRYVIRAENFPRLYHRATGETEWGPVYQAATTVDALELPGGLDIKARGASGRRWTPAICSATVRRSTASRPRRSTTPTSCSTDAPPREV